jgi:hypothetical protein
LNTPFLVLDNTSSSQVGGTPGLFTWNGPEGALSEGEHFFAGGQEFSITYRGGTGNDVVLNAVPEPATTIALLAGTTALVGLYRPWRDARPERRPAHG